MHTFNLIGDRAVAESITCIVYILVILAGYALVVLWHRFYVARTAGGTIAARVIGVILAVPVGNWAARTFVGYYPNLADDVRAESVLLIVFIGLCVAMCLTLLSNNKTPDKPTRFTAPPPGPNVPNTPTSTSSGGTS